MKKIALFLAMSLAAWNITLGQGDSVAKESPKPKYTRATFNMTKLINMQTTEIVSKGNLQFLISHHFSPIWVKDAGAQNNFAQLLGLNSGVAQTYLSFDYSPTEYANIGLAAAGRSRYEGWVKTKILRQQTGARNIPVTIGTYSLFSVNASKDASVQLGWNKWSYLHQVLIARKFSDKFSLELAPTLVYFNEVPYGINNSNFVGSISVGGKYKITSNKNLTFEYSRQLNMYENLIDKNGSIVDYKPDLLSLGLELNTGGHLFQFYVGNTSFSSQIDQLARNTNKLDFNSLAFGFTINRSLSLKKE